MLDYAANSVVYWPAEHIQALFEKTCSERNCPPDEVLSKIIGPDASPDDFWSRVKTNLQAGKIRMLFVADRVPPELRRIVEFLNQQLDPAEVLALELRQFEGDGGLKTLVPHVYGQTEEARQKKAPAVSGPVWDEARVLQDLSERRGAKAGETAGKIAKWMHQKADQVSYGRGKVDGTICASFMRSGQKLTPICIYSGGSVSVNFGWCLKPPFDDEGRRREWLRRLNLVEDAHLPEDAISRFPNLQLSSLSDEVRLRTFLAAMDWFAETFRS